MGRRPVLIFEFGSNAMGNSLPHGKVQPRLPPERRPLDERYLGNSHGTGIHDEDEDLLADRKKSQESDLKKPQESGSKKAQESGLKKAPESGSKKAQESGLKKAPESGLKKSQGGDPLAPPEPVPPVTLPPDVPAALARHIGDLTNENAQLMELLEQARERLQQGERDAEQWKAREQEYETLLEEKSEVIRQLHAQNHDRAATGQGVPTEDELIALQQELERERDILKQDEQAMMAQMREMEMQMARERADFARQRSELQRLQNELRHELEIASRDAALRERLAPLYKLQEEMQRRRVGHDPSQRQRS
jgi:hypothetical protein